ncbi:MAG: NUDIX domain-containing protein [Pseudohongiella sp.]|nr:NUDIX domain-containing protein [Pseudohongiella sp.]
MAASTYIRDMRTKIGHDLLLIPCVAEVITDHEGRIVLQEKSDGEAWSLPAGGIETGESPEIAVIREVLEETVPHVTVQGVLGVFGVTEFRYQYPNMDKVEYAAIFYRCKAVGDGANPKDARRYEASARQQRDSLECYL